MKFTAIIIPLLIFLLFLYCVIKKINVYETFIQGVKKGAPLTLLIMPNILAILLMTEIFEISGLSALIIKLLTPFFTFLGVPKELIKLIIIKPFSGSGSLAYLSEIIKAHGTNGYITLCASTIFGSSETVFYISAVYFTKCKEKKAVKAIIISLTACLFSTVISCLICRFFV